MLHDTGTALSLLGPAVLAGAAALHHEIVQLRPVLWQAQRGAAGGDGKGERGRAAAGGRHGTLQPGSPQATRAP